jgi:hypothetical protein
MENRAVLKRRPVEDLKARRDLIKGRLGLEQLQLALVVASIVSLEMQRLVPGARWLDLVQSPKWGLPMHWELGYVRDESGYEMLAGEDLERAREFFSAELAADYNECFGATAGWGGEAGHFDLVKRMVVERIPRPETIGL